jgi:formylglycine-generating enzyme required for sulfatase activity
MRGERRASRERRAAALAALAACAALAFAAVPALAKSKGDKSQEKAAPAKRVTRKGCPGDMVLVRGYCIDRYEAYVAEVTEDGAQRKHSPFEPVDDKKVVALNKRGRMPQAYISRNEAERACKRAGKRLCGDDEWLTACKGKKPTPWPYGSDWEPGRCNDQGISAFNHFFGENGEPPPQSAYTFEHMNDSRLNREEGTCAPSGKFKRCRGSFKVFDLVGNLHEWTADPGGTFRGGYYLDVRQHGDGCDYKTTAHGPKYHDYSTGFRCCR